MKDLYFEDKFGQKRLVKENISDEELVGAEIVNYVKQLNPNYRIHYLRSWQQEENTTVYDVGSHSEFFYLVEAGR
jgi:hypothetical protein